MEFDQEAVGAYWNYDDDQDYGETEYGVDLDYDGSAVDTPALNVPRHLFRKNEVDLELRHVVLDF